MMPASLDVQLARQCSFFCVALNGLPRDRPSPWPREELDPYIWSDGG